MKKKQCNVVHPWQIVSLKYYGNTIVAPDQTKSIPLLIEELQVLGMRVKIVEGTFSQIIELKKEENDGKQNLVVGLH